MLAVGRNCGLVGLGRPAPPLAQALSPCHRPHCPTSSQKKAKRWSTEGPTGLFLAWGLQDASGVLRSRLPACLLIPTSELCNAYSLLHPSLLLLVASSSHSTVSSPCGPPPSSVVCPRAIWIAAGCPFSPAAPALQISPALTRPRHKHPGKHLPACLSDKGYCVRQVGTFVKVVYWRRAHNVFWRNPILGPWFMVHG